MFTFFVKIYEIANIIVCWCTTSLVHK